MSINKRELSKSPRALGSLRKETAFLSSSCRSGVAMSATTSGEVKCKRIQSRRLQSARVSNRRPRCNSDRRLLPSQKISRTSASLPQTTFTMFRAQLAASRAAARRLYSTRGAPYGYQIDREADCLFPQRLSRSSCAPGALPDTQRTLNRRHSFKSSAVPVCYSKLANYVSLNLLLSL